MAYHDTSGSLQTQGEGSHIQKQQVLHLLAALSTQDGSLQSTIANKQTCTALMKRHTTANKPSTFN